MKIISSYGIEIKQMNKLFRTTVFIYNKAVTFCINVFEKEWEDIKPLKKLKRTQYAENLIHTTKNNKAKYDFDSKFYKMPSYMRRSVINTALGHLSSYYSNLNNWKEKGCKNKKPTLQKHLNQFPTFYKDNMYKSNGDDTVQLKLYIQNDWKWVTVKLKHTDMQYIRKHLQNAKMTVPTLEKRHHKWFLRFVFEENSKLKYTKDKILSVDLGVNTDAVCSVMKKDGTILQRKFINFPSDKDQLTHTLNKIKGISQKYGPHNTTKLWRYAKHLNDELARKISNAIINYAVQQDIDVIVFEHLNFKGKSYGSKKQKLTLWKKNSIQKYVEHKAHRKGIRISHVLARNTSSLAFDGSGKLQRNKYNHSLTTFSNGKIYNCDLSASYNIGARYFIREIQKSISERKWSCVQAKVPVSMKRSKCTYNTFLEILDVLKVL